AGELDRRGVELVGPVRGTNGVVVSIVAPDGERTMASDRGTAALLEPGELDPDWFACDCLHISGYALLASPIDAAAERAAELARGHGARLSIDLSAWTRIRAYGAASFRERLDALAPELVFGNVEEWDELGEVGETRVVVALETTLIAHGFPPGEGVAVGAESERRVREGGAVPATIGVLDGEICVGLTPGELERFDASARKAGPRDLAVCVAQRTV